MDAGQYQKDGVMFVPVQHTPTLVRLNALCAELYSGRTRTGYETKLKGAGLETSLDHRYDPSLVNILFETGLADFIWINFRATLYHMQAVTSIPPGYQSYWHADCHVQPVHRVLYFPSFGSTPEVRSHVLRGSTKPLWANTNRIVSNHFAMGLEVMLLGAMDRETTIYSADDQFVLMNVEGRHRAEPPPQGGAFRLMLSFTEWVPEHERERVNGRKGRKSVPLRFNHNLMQYYWERLHNQVLDVQSVSHRELR